MLLDLLVFRMIIHIQIFIHLVPIMSTELVESTEYLIGHELFCASL